MIYGGIKSTEIHLVRGYGRYRVMLILKTFRNLSSLEGCDVYTPTTVLYPSISSLHDLELRGLPYIAVCSNGVLVYAGIFHPEKIFFAELSNNVETNVVVSDDIFSLIIRLPKVFVSYGSLVEFLEFGHCLGSHTLIEGVNMLEAGKKLLINDSSIRISNIIDYTIPTHEEPRHDLEELAEVFLETVFQVFRDYVSFVKDKIVVVPLSAGIDSRFVLSLLYIQGVKNVVTVTYGLRHSELPTARKVAKELGYENIFIEYTIDEWRKTVQTGRFVEYLQQASQLFRTPNLQEYIAIEKLAQMCTSDDLDCKRGVVIITGDISDVISGKIPPPLMDSFLTFSLFETPYPDEVRKLLYLYVNSIIKELQGEAGFRPLKYNDIFTRTYEVFHLREGPSKYISSTRIPYRLHGFKYVAPLWDYRVVRFLLKLPWKFKWKTSFYRRVVRSIFAELGIDFQDPTKRSNKYVTLLRSSIVDAYLFKYLIKHLEPMLSELHKETSTRIRYRNPCGLDVFYPLVLKHIGERFGDTLKGTGEIWTLIKKYRKRVPKDVVAFLTLAVLTAISATQSIIGLINCENFEVNNNGVT